MTNGCTPLRHRACVAALGLLIAMTPLAGFAWIPWMVTGRAIAGHVIDAETGQPISGAHVIYRWEGSSLRGRLFGGFGHGGASTICYHTAVATTGADGQFQIPAWEKWQIEGIGDNEPVGYAYARGYVPNYFRAWRGVIKVGTLFDHPNDVFKLAPSRATGKARLEELWDFIRRSCAYGGDSQRALVPALTAAYAEARSFAITPDELKQARHFAYMIGSAAVAPDMNSEASSEAQINRYVSEHFPETVPVVNHAIERFAPPPLSGGRQRDPPSRP